MTESISKFKKKILLEVGIKSLFISIFSAIMITSFVLLICKLNGVELPVYAYCLIGLGISLLGTVCLYFILKPNEEIIAKRLDQQLELNQKVQTMIDYQDDDSTLAQVQREDTANRLNAISVKKMKMKFHWSLLIFPLLAIGLLIPALVIPQVNAAPVELPPEEEPSYVLDNETILAIRKLIEDVQGRALDEDVKQAYVQELELLITRLGAENVKESQIEGIVKTSIINENNICKRHTSYLAVAEVLKQSKQTAITSIATAITKANSDEVNYAFDNLRLSLQKTELEEELDSLLMAIRKDIGTALKQAEVNQEAELVKSLISFSDALSECIGKDKNTTNTSFNAAMVEVNATMEKEELIVATASDIEEELRKIFNIIDESKDPSKDPSSNLPNDSNEGKDDTNGNQGGLGGNETLYGSDDAFFDPEKGIVKYGDVITEYHSEIINMILNGTIPEDKQAYFEEYFEILYGKQTDEE